MPVELAAVLDDTDHYIVEQVSVSEFVQRRFLEAFVKRGKWSILVSGQTKSVQSNLSAEDFFQEYDLVELKNDYVQTKMF